MEQLDEIKKKLEKYKGYLIRHFHVKQIGIFGSYVRGTATRSSDIDILVEFEDPPGLLKFLELEEYISQTLGVHADLVTKKALKPTIGKHILHEVVYL